MLVGLLLKILEKELFFLRWGNSLNYNTGISICQKSNTMDDWNSDVIKKEMAMPNTCGGYGAEVCGQAMVKYTTLIRDKVGVVIGSETPWAETALLTHGAKRVIAVEYMPINTDYPGLAAFHPSKALTNANKSYTSNAFFIAIFPIPLVAEMYIKQQWEPFSSLEHDGLGRYGDPINPFADLESVGRAWCMLKDGGIFMLGLPMALDTVVWNAHRIYGKYRLSLVILGFKLMDIVGMDCYKERHGEFTCQPILVLKKIISKNSDN